jgi:hypothetical protein
MSGAGGAPGDLDALPARVDSAIIRSSAGCTKKA